MDNMKDYLTIEDRIELRSLFSNPTQADSLPNYDKGMSTRKLCIAATLTSWVLCILLLVFGIIKFQYFGNNMISLRTSYARVFASLLLNSSITLCVDALGFVHATSLRWALWHEARLTYNSNLRLFTSTKLRTSVTNTALVNLFSAMSLVLCYSGASQIFLDEDLFGVDIPSNFPHAAINAYAFNATSIGIGVQALIASLVLCAPKHILSWSPNPLNTTLACISTGQLKRRSGRSLLALGDPDPAERCAAVQSQQCSLRQIDRSTRHIIRFLWCTTSLALIWAIIVLVMSQLSSGHDDVVRGPTLTTGNISMDIVGSTSLTEDSEGIVQNISSIIIVAIIQAFMTMATHTAEVIINRVRDESVWRRAYAYDQGTHFSTSSTKSAMTSWQYLALSIMKPLVHWMFSLSIQPSDIAGTFVVINLSYLPEFLLFVLAVALACLIMGIARSSPKGVQPATWGHLQTLADLVDDWGTADDKTLYWGDKGIHEDGVRFAGTSAVVGEVGKIRETALYR